MSKEEEKIKLQQVRFAQFRGEPQWVERKLSEVLIEHNLKSSGSEEVFSVSVHKGVINQIEHLGRSFSAATTDHYKQVLPGDIIYTKSPTGDFPYGIIKQNKVGKSVIVSPLYGVFTPETKALGYILDSYFESRSNTYNYLSSIVQKGAKNTINILNDTFLSKALFLPKNTDEQQKIADCLTSLDDLINAENQKLETVKEHKKGLMQQLFPAEGQTVPKLRFAEFKESGDWEEKPLEDVAIFLKGKGISKADISLDGNQPCVRYGELYTHYTEVINSVKSYTNVASDDLILSEANDVIIPSSGETREDIATAACITLAGIALGSDLNIIRSEINGIFLSYYLSHAKKKSISKIAQGDAVVHLYSSQLQKLQINFPKSKNEQQKIASCLSFVDDLITAQMEKIEALKTHKKGLMQQLFPIVAKQNDIS